MSNVFKYCKIVSKNDNRSFDVYKIVPWEKNDLSTFYSLVYGKAVRFDTIDRAMIYFRDLLSCDVQVIDYVY